MSEFDGTTGRAAAPLVIDDDLGDMEGERSFMRNQRVNEESQLMRRSRDNFLEGFNRNR